MNTPSVAAYLQTLTPEQRKVINHLRSIVQTTAPNAIESISYGLPAYKFNNKPLIYFGAFKSHYSIFPTSSPIATLKDELKDFATAKGTIQFTSEHPISDHLVKKIIKARLADIG